MEIDEIKTIVELMAKHNLSEFKVEADNMHLCLKRDITGPLQSITTQPQTSIITTPVMTPSQLSTMDIPKTKPHESPADDRITLNAPIVGTFYRSPSPDAEAYVKIGDRVEDETVVCIIEAMKVLNEIKAEKSGIIKEILVENAQSVEYGCPLFVIE
jgi:acetyl-CoA carboxylase biotin carboxyl carrier protein